MKTVRPVCRILKHLISTPDHREKILYDELKQIFFKIKDSQLDLNVGKFLFEKSLNEIDQNGFLNFEFTIQTLKQSSCLNYHESTYFLSVIYSNIKNPNEMKV